MPFATRSHEGGVGVGAGDAETDTDTVAESVVAPATADTSACTTTVQVPAAMPFSVNVVPDGCEPCADAVQIALVVCCIATGTEAGVPIGALPGLVSVAWAVKESVPPTFIVGDATDTLT